MRTRSLIAATIFLLPFFASADTICPSITANLSYGVSSSQVIGLQQFLASQGYFSATPVARFGTATRAAVQAFQRARGISATGTVGPLTRAAIVATCGGGSKTSTQNTPNAGGSGSFEVTGWIPYWRAATGTADVLPHLDQLTEINPFVYTLKSDGTIADNGNMGAEPWTSLIAAAKQKHVRVIPTIMSGNGDFLHAILSNTTSRVALEDRIAALVEANDFDGIDIDFEGKHAADKNYFSTFLKGLYQRLGKKWVMCTIESRTPLDSRYYGADIPSDATIYSNDFKEINKYCDRVRIMAYDQQGIDLALSAKAESSTELYAPVADPRWVRKTVELAMKDIKPNKILIGVPTYGYEYDVTAYAGNEYTYKILWTFNPGYAWPIANSLGIQPQRNSAGELFFSYNADAAGNPVAPTATGPQNALLAAAAASTFAQANNSHQTFRLMDWPDAQSIAGKVELAQLLGVRGVSIFKLDGGEDPGIWTALLGVKQ